MSVVEDEPSAVPDDVLDVLDVASPDTPADVDVLDDVVSVDPDVDVVLDESLDVPELVDVPDCSLVSLGSVVCAGSLASLGSVASFGSGDSIGGSGTVRPVVVGVADPPPVPLPVDPPEPPLVGADDAVDRVVLVAVPCSRSASASESRRSAFGSAVARSEGSSTERRWRRTAASEAIAERSCEGNACWRVDSACSAATSAGEETGRPAS